MSKDLSRSLPSPRTFLVGVVVGAVVGSGAAGAALHGHVAAVSERSPIQPVKGTERDAASIVEGLRAIAPNPGPSHRVGEAPERGLEGNPAPRTSRSITATTVADRALSFTAFVQGNGVYGSGVVVDASGFVLTAWHVVEDMKNILVSFSDGDSSRAELVDHDARLDLALLKASPRDRVAPTASIVSMKTGDSVFSMGAPRKLKFSLARGMVSYVGRPFGDVLFIQTDIPTNSGNSGGPVMDAHGNVVALQSFILRDSEGLAFAVPIDYAFQRFATHLRPSSTEALARFDHWIAARRSNPTPSSDMVDVGSATNERTPRDE
jgi:S1-C subfamily serine protease